MFYCLHALKAHTRKGGTSPVLREDRVGIDRECIYIELDKGNTKAPSVVEGKVIGFSNYYNNQPFDYGCFESSCFLGSGIWTLAYTAEVIESLKNRGKAVEKGCIEDCFEDFNQVCKVQLPYDYLGPLKYYITDEGKFALIDVNQDYCEEEYQDQQLPVNPYITGSYIEGSRSYTTYTQDDITLAIAATDDSYEVYVLTPENQCWDQCSISRLNPVAVYELDGSVRHDLSLLEGQLFNNDVLIDEDYYLYVNGYVESNHFNSSTTIDDDFTLYKKGTSLFEIYSYSLNSISSMGINVPSIGSLIPQILSKHIELTNYRREFNPLHKCIRYCDNRLVEINGIEVRYSNSYEVWVEGLVDLEGYVYVADIGYIHPLNHEIVVWERNIPLTTGGRFKSRTVIPAGPKMIKIKRVDRYKETTILHHITPNRSVLRTSTGHLLGYNREDQEIDLEVVSITMINILLSSYSLSERCFNYEESSTLDPELLESVRQTLDFLCSLINRKTGSIPKSVATFSTYESIYDNPKYEDPTIKPFESGVFSEDCFLEEEDRTLVSRDIDHRAICWFIYALCTYVEVTHDRSYLSYIEILSSYLINEKNRVHLLRQGYVDGEAVEQYESSYSIMFVLSMMRVHDLTLSPQIINEVANTYLSLNNYLYINQSDLFSHSYEIVESSTESLIYGLLYSISVNKQDCLEASLSLIKSRLKPKDPYSYPKTIIADGKPVVDKEGRVLLSSRSLKSISLEGSLLPIYSRDNEETVSLSYLLDTAITSIEPIPLISSHLQGLIESQIRSRHRTNTILLSYCLDDEVVGHPLWKSHSLYDLETLLFHRRFIKEKLLSIPKNYTWFDESALKEGGIMGSLLNMVSTSLSNWYVGMRRLKKGIVLSQAEDQYLDVWGQTLSLTRKVQETQDSYRERIRSLLTLIGVTKNRLEEALLAQGVKLSIEQTSILSSQGFLDKPFSPYGNLQGSQINASTIMVKSQRLEEKDRAYFESLLPIGTQPLYQESIQLTNCERDFNSDTYINIGEELYNFDYEILCCAESSQIFYVSVELDNNYSIPIYVFGAMGESFILDLSHTYRRQGLIGIIRAGQSNSIFRVDTTLLPGI